METPSVTPVQKIVAAGTAVVTALFGVLNAFGVGVSDGQQAAILGFVAAIGGALAIADALIRHGRVPLAQQREAQATYDRLVKERDEKFSAPDFPPADLSVEPPKDEPK